MNPQELILLFSNEFVKDIAMFENMAQRILSSKSDEELQLNIQTYIVNTQRICDGAASLGLNGIYLYIQQVTLNLYEAKLLPFDQQEIIASLYTFWLEPLKGYLDSAETQDPLLIEAMTEMLMTELTPPNILVEIAADDLILLKTALNKVIEVDEQLESLISDIQNEHEAIFVYEDEKLNVDYSKIEFESLTGLLQECDDNIQAVEQNITNLFNELDDIINNGNDLPNKKILDFIEHAKRAAHTIKGSSQMSGIFHLSLIFHKIEDLFDYTQIKDFQWLDLSSPDLKKWLLKLIEEGSLIIESLQDRSQYLRSEALKIRLDNFLNVFKSIVNNTEVPTDLKDWVPTVTQVKAPEEKIELAINNQPTAKAAATSNQDVNNELLSDLFESVNHSRVILNRVKTNNSSLTNSLHSAQIETDELHKKLDYLNNFVTTYLLENNDSISSLEKRNYSEVYTLSIGIGEINNNMKLMLDQVNSGVQNINMLLSEMDRNEKEISQNILSAQMIPFEEIYPRLKRIVSTTSQMCEKEVSFDFISNNTLIEKTVLEELKEPLMHILRNSIDHGFSDMSGGKIKFTVKNTGSKIVLKIQDNGGGINLKKVGKKAIDKNLISEEQLKNMSEHEIINIIFQTGFSTKEVVTDISGRGVGLDIVKRKIESLGGTIDASNNIEQGSCFDITVPSNLSTVNALVLKIEEQYFAVPTAFIDRILETGSFETMSFKDGVSIKVEEDYSHIEYSDNSKKQIIRTINFNKFARIPTADVVNKKNKSLILKYGAEKLSVLIDELLLIDDLVLKKANAVGKSKRYIIGTTIQLDGHIVPILNIPELITATPWSEQHNIVVQTSSNSTPKILVVDDSLFMRTFLEKDVKKMGYEPVLAINGIDALNKLKTTNIQLILTDLEMPEMDGLELVRYLKNNDSYKELPIFMITSRSTDRYKDEAFKVGVNEFFSKPFDSHELQEKVYEYMGD